MDTSTQFVSLPPEFRSEAEALDAYSRVVTSVAESASPAVVRIQVETASGRGGGGSGFVLTPDGFILTNRHVVHKAAKIKVSTPDSWGVSPPLPGENPGHDLAILP